jgi:outer membrane murein-binding lipoprotein Lpp
MGWVSKDEAAGELSAEVERLRALVGPSEVDFGALQRDRDEARATARAAEMEAGQLRGRIAEISVQLARARQDQDLLLRRIEMTTVERLIDRTRHRLQISVVPRVKRLAGRAP